MGVFRTAWTEFLVDAGFVCDKAPVTAAVPRDMIRSTLYHSILFVCYFAVLFSNTQLICEYIILFSII